MTENKTKEVIEGVSKQVGQTWTKVQPQLQALLLKLVKSLLPALRNLQTKLIKSDLIAKEGEDASATTSTDNLSSNPNLNKVLDIGKSLSAKAIATLIVALTKLQQSLEGQESTLDATGEATGLLNASTELDSPLVAQVKQEFGIAWKFVKEQVTPKILAFLQISVDKLDPIATNVWQKVRLKRQQPLLWSTLGKSSKTTMLGKRR